MFSPNDDETGIHCIINRYIYDDNRYSDIFYLFYDNSDGKWYKADETTEFTLGSSHTAMDLVYDSPKSEGDEDLTYCWDIQDDGSGNPHLIYIVDKGMRRGNASPGDVYRANHSGGSWNSELVLADGSGRFWYISGAVFDPLDVDTIYLTPGTDDRGPLVARTQLQKWQKVSGNWTKIEDITQASPGSHARPQAVRNAPAGNLFRILWCYITHYEGTPYTQWGSCIFAYPGLDN